MTSLNFLKVFRRTQKRTDRDCGTFLWTRDFIPNLFSYSYIHFAYGTQSEIAAGDVYEWFWHNTQYCPVMTFIKLIFIVFRATMML